MIFKPKSKFNITDFIYTVRQRFEQKCGLINGKSILFMDDIEIPVLCMLAEQSRIGIVEIGCLYGGSAALILRNKPFSVPFASIDPFIPDSMENEASSTKELTLKNIQRFLGTNPNKFKFNLIKDYSYNVTKAWKNPIDLLWIDGDHSYEGVRKDFFGWKNYMVSGGRIAIHDSRRMDDPAIPENKYNRGWPGPTRLVQEIKRNFSKEFQTEFEIASITVFRKINT